MTLLATILVFIGFYALYYTSKKAVLHYDNNFELWMKQNPKQSKNIGLLFLIGAYTFLVFSNALGTGTLIFFIQLMTIGSLVIILRPLKNNKS